MSDTEKKLLNVEFIEAVSGARILEKKYLYALKSYIDQRFEILERQVSLLSEGDDFPDGYMP